MYVLRWSRATISSGSSVSMLIQSDGHSSQEEYPVLHRLLIVFILFHLFSGHKWLRITLFFQCLILSTFVKGQVSAKLIMNYKMKEPPDTWATEVGASGVCMCVYVLSSLRNWQSEEEQWLSVSTAPLLLCEDGQLPKAKSLMPSSPGTSEADSSDINKKSQSTTLFRGLISFCKVIHLSGVKTVMALCVCLWVLCERARGN